MSRQARPPVSIKMHILIELKSRHGISRKVQITNKASSSSIQQIFPECLLGALGAKRGIL